MVNVQPAKTAKFFNLENFRLYGNNFKFVTLVSIFYLLNQLLFEKLHCVLSDLLALRT